MSAEEDYRTVQEASEARRMLREVEPTLQEHIKQVYVAVKAHKVENKGVLSPEYAVQAWYRVEASLELERKLESIVRRGVQTSRKASVA